MKTIKFLLALFIIFGLAVPAFADHDGMKQKGKLKEVLKRGELNCGVRSGTNQNILGDEFSDSSGQKIGELYCRGLAAALEVDVNIIKLGVSELYEALHSDTVDVNFRTNTEQLGRDVVDLVNMIEVMYYGTIVAKTAYTGYPLNGAVAEQVAYIIANNLLVCVRVGQIQESIARQAGLGDGNLFLTDEDVQSYFDGDCAVNMNVSSLQTQITDPSATAPWAITPFSVMTSEKHSDRRWDDLIKYYMGGLRASSRFGITKLNAGSLIPEDPEAKALLGITTNCRGETAGDLFGLDANWMVRAISTVGSYYDMYDASLGRSEFGALNRVKDDAGLNQVFIDDSGRTNGALVDHSHSPVFTATSFAKCP